MLVPDTVTRHDYRPRVATPMFAGGRKLLAFDRFTKMVGERSRGDAGLSKPLDHASRHQRARRINKSVGPPGLGFGRRRRRPNPP